MFKQKAKIGKKYVWIWQTVSRVYSVQLTNADLMPCKMAARVNFKKITKIASAEVKYKRKNCRRIFRCTNVLIY